MRRRDILAIFAGTAVPWPLLALAQQAERLRVIGVLIGVTENDPTNPPRIEAFQRGLQDLGWIEGRNTRIHYRWAADADRMRTFAQELVALQPDVLVASSTPTVAALLRETRTMPIVFVTASDPVGDGFVENLVRPGGNATGFTNNLSSMGGKSLELLREIAPTISHAGVMFNPDTAPSGGSYFVPPLEAAATSLAVRPIAIPVRNPTEIESAFAAIGREPGGGLIIMPDNFTTVHRGLIVALAARHRVPAIYPFRYFATDGGLMSYGADLIELYRRTPSYVDRILKGANPAELSVQAPTKLELVINLKVAKTLGLTVPRIMLARADEVIE
jgi:putative tryptophan/tyrosine transport system substrate-binding protein